MNRQDFQRNFQFSYFGLIVTPALIAALKNQLVVNLNDYHLELNDILPCAGPRVRDAETMQCSIILVKKGEDYGEVFKVILKWWEDCDEDPLYMRPGVPVTGMIQGPCTAIYVSRSPTRDVPRGYCPKFNSTRSVNKSLLENTGITNGNEFYTIWRIYNKVTYSWNEAADIINQGLKLGAVVDKFMALGIVQGSSNTKIFYKNNGAVGHLIGNQPVIYSEFNTYSLREYVRKISGVEPEVIHK